MATLNPLRTDGPLTAIATSAVTGGQVVKISAVRVGGPALNTNTTGTNYKVAPCTANGVAIGVAGQDMTGTGTEDDNRSVIYTSGVVQCTATNATIAVGVQVEAGAAGCVQTLSTGPAIGVALQNATANGLVDILLNVA
jgi:hypothetical protein